MLYRGLQSSEEHGARVDQKKYFTWLDNTLHAHRHTRWGEIRAQRAKMKTRKRHALASRLWRVCAATQPTHCTAIDIMERLVPRLTETRG